MGWAASCSIIIYSFVLFFIYSFQFLQKKAYWKIHLKGRRDVAVIVHYTSLNKSRPFKINNKPPYKSEEYQMNKNVVLLWLSCMSDAVLFWFVVLCYSFILIKNVRKKKMAGCYNVMIVWYDLCKNKDGNWSANITKMNKNLQIMRINFK